MIDKHLQREITDEEGEPIEESEEVVEDDDSEESENSTSNDEVSENEEIEKFSQSQLKLLEEIETKIKKLSTDVSKIKRKKPPEGDTSDEALTPEAKIKANWFEVDV